MEAVVLPHVIQTIDLCLAIHTVCIMYENMAYSHYTINELCLFTPDDHNVVHVTLANLRSHIVLTTVLSLLPMLTKAVQAYVYKQHLRLPESVGTCKSSELALSNH